VAVPGACLSAEPSWGQVPTCMPVTHDCHAEVSVVAKAVGMADAASEEVSSSAQLACRALVARH